MNYRIKAMGYYAIRCNRKFPVVSGHFFWNYVIRNNQKSRADSVCFWWISWENHVNGNNQKYQNYTHLILKELLPCNF